MAASPSGGSQPDQATLAAFVGVVLFGGANAVGVRQTVLELAPFWGATVRFVAAGLIMIVIAAVLRRGFPRGRSLWGAVLYGLVGFAGSYGFFYLGLVSAPAIASVMVALTPLLTFALAILHRQERFRLQGLVGALIAVAGTVVVFIDQLSLDVPLTSLVLLLLGTLCVAESGVIVKLIPRADPFATNGVAMLTGSAILVGLSFATGEARAIPERPATWLAIGYLVVLGSVIMFSLYLFALSRWTASAMSYVTLLFPITTVVLAVALTGEQASILLLVGGALVLAGVYVGAFLTPRPRRSSASSLPECLPVQDCAPAGVTAARA